MKRHLNKNFCADGRQTNENLVDIFLRIEQSLHALPELSNTECLRLEHEIAISHLYYSSKIEGVILDEVRLEKATTS